jgi:hypothetical protein
MFSKNAPLSNVIKLRPVGAELLHADGRTYGQTDMTKLIVAFHNFAKSATKPIVVNIVTAKSNP